MSGLFSTLSMSSSALGVNQTAINVVSNNIANMNTEGYSKQKVNLSAIVLGIPIGDNVAYQAKTNNGVEITSIDRYTTTFIGSYYREQISEQSYLNKQEQAITDIANMFDELKGQGLDTVLEDFYAALDNLNQYPSDMTARINFLDAAQALTNSMNKTANNLTELKNLSVGDGESLTSLEKSEIYSSIQIVNQGFEDLARINKMIATSQTGTLENNNLLDQRDKLLKDLSQYANFKTEIQDNGTVNLSLGGTKLVTGAEVVGKLDVQTAKQYDEYCKQYGIDNTNESNAVIMIRKNNGTVVENVNKKFESGTIGAILSTASSQEGVNVNTILNDLDKLAQTVADVFNELQTREGAFYIDNTGGTIQLSNANIEDYEIFTASDGTNNITASNITINALLLEDGGYNRIATAYFPDYDPLDPDSVDLNAIGNADNIIAMINTKTDNTSAAFDTIGNISLSDYYSGILGKITSTVTAKSNEASAQNAVVSSLDTKAKEQTGVDLNEELTDLVKFQTAYSASARVFSTCNTLLDTLVNLGL